MCEFLFCLQLRESLDAAFRGGVYEGADWIGAWGRAVVQSFKDAKRGHPPGLLWQIAHSSLQSIIMNCPCEGIAENILGNPDAFVRTTLILASRCPSTREPVQSVVLH
jgi:hypothetical protein